MCFQAVLILIIYLIFFRADGGSMENAYKILRGLNSKTFNYLTHSDVKSTLGVGKELPIFHMPGDEPKTDMSAPFDSEDEEVINSMKFFSQCVRWNRPCKVKRFTKTWNAFSKWNTEEDDNALSYMESLIGVDTIVQAH